MRTGDVRPELVTVPAGSFRMGAEDGLPDEAPVHVVELRAFRVAVRPVSNREWAAHVEATGAEPAPFLDRDGLDVPDAPVVGISWEAATRYADWCAEVTGLPLRLPTEAERERAARGGLERATWPWGDLPPEEHPGARAVAGLDAPHVPRPGMPEGCANALGLLCMGCNVHEWCSDWHAPYPADAAVRRDPIGPPSGRRRASRGGSFRHRVPFTRVAARSSLPPDRAYADYGLRLAADASA